MIFINTAVLLLAAVSGAWLRFLTDRHQRLKQYSLPAATILVNTIGSLIAGALTGVITTVPLLPAVSPILELIVIGFCGALTTVSTASVQTAEFLLQKNFGLAALNIFLPLCATLVCASLGYNAVLLIT